MKTAYLIFAAFLIGFGERVFGQTAPTFEETVSFSVPKTIYFTGEKIWLSIDVAISSGPSPSRIVYAELWNRHSESVAMAKIPLQGGRAINYLEIPIDLPSDQYLLRVFTRVSPYQNPELGLVQEFVTLFNPRIPPKVVESRMNTSRPQNASAFLEFSNLTVAPDEQLKVSYTGPGSVEEFAVAVANPFLEKRGKESSKALYDAIPAKAIVPEFFGHIIEARVLDSKADSTASDSYFLSLHGERSALFTDKRDEKGSLFFDTGGFRYWEYLIAQSRGSQPMDRFEIISPSPQTKFRPNFEFPSLEISPADSSFLRHLLLGSQIGGYFAQKFEEVAVPVVLGFVADRTFLLDDYNRFEDVETHIKEYVPEVLVRTQDKHKELRVLNALQGKSFTANPLILLDAMPVFDSDQLLRFNPEKIKRLDIVSRPFFLNEETYSGVVSFDSFKNDFGGFPLSDHAVFVPYRGLQPRVTETERLFSPLEQNTELSDWRTVLYWSEVLENTDPSKEVSITAPMVEGYYQVKIKIKSPSGEIGYEYAWFEVK